MADPKQKYDYRVAEVPANQRGSHPVLTVTVPISETEGNEGKTRAIQRLLSIELKNEIFGRRHEWGLSDHGIEKTRGYEPVYAPDKKTVVGYATDFKFTRRI